MASLGRELWLRKGDLAKVGLAFAEYWGKIASLLTQGRRTNYKEAFFARSKAGLRGSKKKEESRQISRSSLDLDSRATLSCKGRLDLAKAS